VSRGGRRVDDCGPDDRLIETRRKKETGKKRWAARLPPGASVVSSVLIKRNKKMSHHRFQQIESLHEASSRLILRVADANLQLT
jgi:hypothetical protein